MGRRAHPAFTFGGESLSEFAHANSKVTRRYMSLVALGQVQTSGPAGDRAKAEGVLLEQLVRRCLRRGSGDLGTPPP